jgi:RNA-directed DNA polymerase
LHQRVEGERHPDAAPPAPPAGPGHLAAGPLRGRLCGHGGRHPPARRCAAGGGGSGVGPDGLRLSDAKTKIAHIDEGFDFLGFRIQRQTRRGGNGQRHVYTYPTKKALAAIKATVRALTRAGTNQPLAAVCSRLNLVLRGWTNYFRHSVAKATFNYLCSYAWRRVCWLRHKHPRTSWKRLRRRYLPG